MAPPYLRERPLSGNALVLWAHRVAGFRREIMHNPDMHTVYFGLANGRA